MSDEKWEESIEDFAVRLAQGLHNEFCTESWESCTHPDCIRGREIDERLEEA